MSESFSTDGSCAAIFIMLRPFCADCVPVNCCLYLGGGERERAWERRESE